MQSEIGAEIRAAMQGFGEQYGSELQELRAKVREQRETVASIEEDAVSNLPLKEFNDLLQCHNSVLQDFSYADLNERIAGFNQKLAKFSMDQLFNHMTQLTSLTETARKTVTTLSQVSTTRDFITAQNQMIETRVATDLLVSDWTALVSTVRSEEGKRESK